MGFTSFPQSIFSLFKISYFLLPINSGWDTEFILFYRFNYSILLFDVLNLFLQIDMLMLKDLLLSLGKVLRVFIIFLWEIFLPDSLYSKPKLERKKAAKFRSCFESDRRKIDTIEYQLNEAISIKLIQYKFPRRCQKLTQRFSDCFMMTLLFIVEFITICFINK